MPVRIRLKRIGTKKKPFYRIVVADSRAPRDGRFIEEIGYYNPTTVPTTFEINRDKYQEWIAKGAKPSDTVKSLYTRTGQQVY
ncbi:MAG: 30S ribosomal protein S16 [Dethiobacteria bacterium]